MVRGTHEIAMQQPRRSGNVPFGKFLSNTSECLCHVGDGTCS